MPSKWSSRFCIRRLFCLSIAVFKKKVTLKLNGFKQQKSVYFPFISHGFYGLRIWGTRQSGSGLSYSRKSEWPKLEHYWERGGWSNWELPEHIPPPFSLSHSLHMVSGPLQNASRMDYFELPRSLEVSEYMDCLHGSRRL